MEAMSAGLSVIATDACGFTSDIKPTMLVNSGDVEGLAAAMRRVHEMDDAQRAAEGVRLQNEAKRYSDSAWVERFLRLMGEKGKGEE
jgi:glycosyltransferase involved in cell wall biosynthesis